MPRFTPGPLNLDKVSPRVRAGIGPEHFKSYAVSAPVSTHWRPGTCEEYECDDYLHGFVFTCDLSTELGQSQYYYLTHDKERRYSIQRPSENIVKFIYGPGNRCFSRTGEPHYVPVGRPPFYLVHGGDWRGNPRGDQMVHRRVEDWIDDFANHQDKIATRTQRG